ncbi:hypothetical protein F5148DRAFT_1277918 [Russula earlei]|uniref:Uncharacterized protein n=1 Tax=Russula earlei TaxID=71964 RepID=A0ACC0TWG9_9AGAM|nr:hypothetical protein F5148DRAFT_1277918 [Russula earlei]
MSTPTPRLSFTVRRPTPESRATSTGPDSDDNLPALPRHLTQDYSANNSTPGSPLAGRSPKRSAPGSPNSSDEENDQPTDELVTGFDRFGVQRAARRRREAANGKMYVPPHGKAGTGADGSVGGLGTRDTINSWAAYGRSADAQTCPNRYNRWPRCRTRPTVPTEGQPEETEDQRAIRALLAGAEPDVDELPDEATLEEYERVPVSQFGQHCCPASRNLKRGIVEPWLPPSRPALLGIGAKERERNQTGRRHPHSLPASRSESRRASRSPGRRERREGDRERRRGCNLESEQERDRDGRRDRDRESERDRDRRRDRDRSPRPS